MVFTIALSSNCCVSVVVGGRGKQERGRGEEGEKGKKKKSKVKSTAGLHPGSPSVSHGHVWGTFNRREARLSAAR